MPVDPSIQLTQTMLRKLVLFVILNIGFLLVLYESQYRTPQKVLWRAYEESTETSSNYSP